MEETKEVLIRRLTPEEAYEKEFKAELLKLQFSDNNSDDCYLDSFLYQQREIINC